MVDRLCRPKFNFVTCVWESLAGSIQKIDAWIAKFNKLQICTAVQIYCLFLWDYSRLPVSFVCYDLLSRYEHLNLVPLLTFKFEYGDRLPLHGSCWTIFEDRECSEGKRWKIREQTVRDWGQRELSIYSSAIIHYTTVYRARWPQFQFLLR